MDSQSPIAIPSHRTCKWPGCDAPCAWEDSDPSKPCWGYIEIVESFPDPEGGDAHIHGCRGHENMWHGEYTPEPKDGAITQVAL